MKELTVEKIAGILDGQIFRSNNFRNFQVEKIIIDSRSFFNIQNSVFFALKGPRNDGHHYIESLIVKGVSTFVISEPDFISPEATFILVTDTTKALQHLAAFVRGQFNYPVIGITGSNGKTIVKEWLFSILSGQFKIVRNPKSYNSQVGVPLSVLLMEDNYNLAIFEAGISQPGEMHNLTEIIQPEIGIFTNIGGAHQEGFNSTEQKISEKLLLFNSCKKLVYCEDQEKMEPLIADFCALNGIEKINWSLKNRDAKLFFSYKTGNGSTQISAFYQNHEIRFKIPFSDFSSLENACHCFAAAVAVNADLTILAEEFRDLFPVEMRLEIKQGINNCLLVNDYYNSDLNSLAIALSVLQQQAAKAQLSKLVILSDIKQTGLPKPELYKQVNNLLQEWKTGEIIGIGEEISQYRDVFSMKGSFFPSTEAFLNQVNRTRFQLEAILIKGARQFTFEKISAYLQSKAHLTRLEIDLNALTHNLNVYRSLLKPGTKMMVMVKAFSYGSGDIEIASALQYQHVDYLAVAVSDEGVHLRNAGISTPIIVMNPEQQSFQNIIDYGLEPNIYSAPLLESFLKTAEQFGVKEFPVHLKIDTGMNRLGFKSETEIKKIVEQIRTSNHLIIKSVFSHLAGSDEPTFDDFTLSQFKKFDKIANLIAGILDYKFDRHILNSAGIERFPEKQFEMVRLGIGLYGVSCTGLPLRNIGRLMSTVSQVKKVNPEETVGYSRKGKVTAESRIAVVPLGYADGLDRKLSNRNGSVFINGERAPIIGNICMDMMMADVTGLDVKPGDSVEIFGDHISITEIAEKVGTIPYEILTGISQRVKRIYLQE
jgi:alanine racemase